MLAIVSGQKLKYPAAISLTLAVLPNKMDWLVSSLCANYKSFIWTLFSYLFTDMLVRKAGERVTATEWTSIHHDEILGFP